MITSFSIKWLLLFRNSVVSSSLQPHGLHHDRLPCPSPSPEALSNSYPLSQWCHPSCPLSSPSPLAFSLSKHQGLFQWIDSPSGDQSIGASASALKSPSTPQFKSINYLAFSFLYSPTLISIHDYWKNNSLDKIDLCWQSNVSAF